jgi:predicted DNA-binding protein
MTSRLNARIDDALAAKLDYIQRRTNQSVTDIVRESIEQYYERFRQEQERAPQALEQSGFIGCGQDDADLAATYKQRLGQSLADKTGA